MTEFSVVAEGLAFPEGPVWMPDGSLLIVELAAGTVSRILPDGRKQVIERFTKEFAPLVTSGPPGVTGYTTGRPPVREVFAYWPALINKGLVTSRVEVLK